MTPGYFLSFFGFFVSLRAFLPLATSSSSSLAW
jgi:hypothetical protein